MVAAAEHRWPSRVIARMPIALVMRASCPAAACAVDCWTGHSESPGGPMALWWRQESPRRCRRASRCILFTFNRADG